MTRNCELCFANGIFKETDLFFLFQYGKQPKGNCNEKMAALDGCIMTR